jgi:hypothetical protein
VKPALDCCLCATGTVKVLPQNTSAHKQGMAGVCGELNLHRLARRGLVDD